MRNLQCFILAFLLLSACLRTEQQLAQSRSMHPIDARLEQCLKEFDITMQGIVACELEAYEAWDSLLNSHYQQLLAALPAAQAKLLKEAQRAWLVYCDKEMDFLSAFYENKQGTIWNAISVKRAYDLTRARALELENYLEDFKY